MPEVPAVHDRPSVDWPLPIINDPCYAIGDASCSLERIIALHKANNAKFAEDFIDRDFAAPDWLKDRATSIWMIHIIVGEKLQELDRLLCAIDDHPAIVPISSVGRHVEIMRHAAWVTAVDRLKAAEADPDGSNEACDKASAAFDRMVAARVPSLRALHEKMTLIQSARGWWTNGVTDALIDDVEHLVRRYEIVDQAHQSDTAETADGAAAVEA